MMVKIYELDVETESKYMKIILSSILLATLVICHFVKNFLSSLVLSLRGLFFMIFFLQAKKLKFWETLALYN